MSGPPSPHSFPILTALTALVWLLVRSHHPLPTRPALRCLSITFTVDHTPTPPPPHSPSTLPPAFGIWRGHVEHPLFVFLSHSTYYNITPNLIKGQKVMTKRTNSQLLDAPGFLTWFTHQILPQFPLEPTYFESLLRRSRVKRENANAEKTSIGRRNRPGKNTDKLRKD